MKVFLTGIGETELVAMLAARARACPDHSLCSDPAEADLILLAGSFGQRPELLLEHACYRAMPDKCAVYTEDDSYLPLAPGVYCSAHLDESHKIGRSFSYTYVSRNGQYSNAYLAEARGVGEADVLPASRSKKYLFTFQGASTSVLRKKIFRINFGRPDILVENTSSYFHWDESQAGRLGRQRAYANTVASSQFVLCPRGAGVGTIRLFEVMAAGVAPVLLSDHYALPFGPDWDSFLLRVPERKLNKLADILEREASSSDARGKLARAAFEQYFSTAQEFTRIVELASRSLRHGAPAEAAFRQRHRSMIQTFQRKQKLRDIARTIFMRGLKLLRLKNPYQLNR